jgi:hypothetical protein
MRAVSHLLISILSLNSGDDSFVEKASLLHSLRTDLFPKDVDVSVKEWAANSDGECSAPDADGTATVTFKRADFLADLNAQLKRLGASPV